VRNVYLDPHFILFYEGQVLRCKMPFHLLTLSASAAPRYSLREGLEATLAIVLTLGAIAALLACIIFTLTAARKPD
jgi:hypothetical protein